MTIANLHTLTDRATDPNSVFKQQRFAILAVLEGNVPTPYFDTKGIITIGIGFNIDTVPDNRRDVMNAMGLNATQQASIKTAWLSARMTDIKTMPQATTAELNAKNAALRTYLNSILSAGQSFRLTDSQIKTVFDDLVEEHQAAIFSLISTPSLEQIVLTSLHYNGLVGPGLKAALALPGPAEARAEAWYQIRYAHANQLHMRRFAEAALFGLYDNDGRVDLTEALAIYRMFTRHRAETNASAADMIAYDNRFANDSRYGIPAANDVLAAVGFGTDLVKTLSAELTPAATMLIAQYVKPEYNITTTFNPLNIQVASDRATMLMGEDTIARTGSNADLLIGRDGAADFLIGRGGNDLLIGLGGNDTLSGGAGNDLMVGGEGEDTYIVEGNDRIHDTGRNFIVYNGALVAGMFTRLSDGHYQFVGETDIPGVSNRTLTFHSPGVLVLGDGDSVTFDLQTSAAGFADGDFGLALEETQPEVASDWTLTGTAYRDEMSLFNVGTNPADWKLWYTSYSPGVTENTPSFEQPLTAVAPRLEITGGESGDFLFGFNLHDHIDGGPGDDIITGYLGTYNGKATYPSDILEGDLLEGGEGNDFVSGSGGDDHILAGEGDDIVEGFDGADHIAGAGGADALAGGSHDDIVLGGDGDDAVFGDGYYTDGGTITLDNRDQYRVILSYSGGAQGGFPIGYTSVGFTIQNNAPQAGNDFLAGGAGRDYLDGGAGDDTLLGETDPDALLGDNGDLTGSGNDVLWGEAGDDTLYGLGGDDALTGGSGHDTLVGGEGNDVLSGAGGIDLLEGGAGDDTYVFATGDSPQEQNGSSSTGEWLNDGEGVNTLVLPQDYPVQLYASQDGASLTLQYGQDDFLFFSGGLAGATGYVVNAGGETYGLLSLVGQRLDTPLELTGSAGADILQGGLADDSLSGNDGADLLTGSGGNDLLAGGTGNDTYVFGYGDGQDTIVDTGGEDTLRLAGILEEEVRVERSGSDLLLQVRDSADRLVVSGFFAARAARLVRASEILPGEDQRIERVEFDDGTVWDEVRIAELVALNDAPLLAVPLSDQGATEGSLFSYTVPEDTFADMDWGDSLVYSATLANGEALPAWLTFTPENRAVSGIPPSGTAGVLSVVVNAMDNGGLSASDVFDINIAHQNHAPALAIPLPDQSTIEDSPFSYTVPENAFVDPDAGDILTYSATMDNGESMPAWLIFDPASRTFSGIPPSGSAGTVRLSVTATDAAGLAASCAIELYVAANGLTVNGTPDSDSLLGGDRNDFLHGLGGDDTLAGGYGDDALAGGVGNDTYVFNRGDGQDAITEAGGMDTLRFGAGISPDAISLGRYGYAFWPGAGVAPLIVPGSISVGNRDGYDLLVSLGGGDQIRIQNWGNDPGLRLERVEFADGGVAWDAAYLSAMAADAPIVGFEGNDYLRALPDENATIQGLGGDDRLDGGVDVYPYGDGCNDILDGGTGNDSLAGGAGYDIYLFNRGGGQDTINDEGLYYVTLGGDVVYAGGHGVLRFGQGIAPGDITFVRSGMDLTLGIDGGNDQVRIKNWGYGDRFRPGNVEFTDGTVWDTAYVQSRVLPILLAGGTDGDDELRIWADENDVILQGGGGNDTLRGHAANDTLAGGIGNDFMEGNGGVNTYLFNRGDGHDRIAATVQDLLSFGPGIVPDDITFERSGMSLALAINDGNDRILLEYWGSSEHRLGEVQFDDGTVWDTAYIHSRIRDLPILGTTGPDNYLYAWDDESTTIQGLGENDSLMGRSGNDTLEGGGGNDIMTGQDGADVYLFNQGDGQDMIHADNLDTLRFGAGIAPNDITWSRSGDGLILDVGTVGDRVEIAGWASDAQRHIGRVEFSDGTVWDTAYLQARIMASPFAGTIGNDIMYAWPGENAFLQGGAGNDTFWGVGGNDTLEGGTGDDAMNGGLGNDTYLYHRNDGSDTISDFSWETDGESMDILRFGVGIVPNDITIGRDGYDLLLSVNGGGDVRMEGWGLSATRVERVEFADGTLWDASYILSEVSLLPIVGDRHPWTFEDSPYMDVMGAWQGESAVLVQGLLGDDYLAGSHGNDTLDGGVGNDFLEGYDGNDTYLYSRGKGHDTILESDGDLDTIRFGAGIIPADITVNRDYHSPLQDSYDLLLDINGGANDQIRISKWGSDDCYFIERVEFADGTAWDATDILSITSLPTVGTDGADVLRARAIDNAVIFGLAGNDTLWGDNGNNTMEGGAGNDSLNGGSGNDVLAGSTDNDSLQGGKGDDALSGGAGDDMLFGQHGDDTIDGGMGNDTMDGGYDSDIYLFGRGDGHDIVNNFAELDSGGIDVLVLANDVHGADIDIERQDDNLLLTILESGDRVTVADYFLGDGFAGRAVEEIRLPADNLVYSIEEIKRLVFQVSDSDDTLIGYGETSDTISGLDGNDTIDGRGGDDILDGGNGDDTLIGGSGDDLLIGGFGSDTYLLNRGGGIDVIDNFDTDSGKTDALVLPGDVLVSDIGIRRNGDDLVLTIRGGNAQATVVDYFSNDALDGHAVEEIRVPADRVVFTVGDIKQLVVGGSNSNDVLTGYATADTIDGYGGNDIIDGRGGEDVLRGGIDQDTLIGGAGNDIMIGGVGNDTYEVDSAGDVVFEDVSGEGGWDTVNAFCDYLLNDNVESLAFLGNADLNGAGNATDNEIVGNSGSNHLDGGAGNDSLRGGGGNDTLTGGGATDSDFLYGEAGEDTYLTYAESDLVEEGFDAGTDTERRFFDSQHMLAANIENLELQGNVVHGSGNDLDNSIIGNATGNTISGGYGTNNLDGGAGGDTFVLTAENLPPWDGRTAHDTVTDGGGADRVLFLNDVAREDIVFTLDGIDLMITYGLDLQHTMRVIGNSVERFETSDGSSITRETVEATLAAMAALAGTEVATLDAGMIAGDLSLNTLMYNAWTDGFVEHHGNEYWNEFVGNAQNEIVYGGNGYDGLAGHSGNDRLIGMAGDDDLNAGNGNDTYLFGRGDNNDTILDAENPLQNSYDYGGYGGSYDYGGYGGSVDWDSMANPAPSNDTLLLGEGIRQEELDAFWGTDMWDWSNQEINDLVLRVNPANNAGVGRQANIDAIVGYFSDIILYDQDGNGARHATVLSSDELEAFSDKALQHVAYSINTGSYDDYALYFAIYTNDHAALLAALDALSGQSTWFEDYRWDADTIRIRQFYDQRYTIENITIKGENYSLTNNDLMRMMATDSAEMIRGVDWAGNRIDALAGGDAVVGGEGDDTLGGGRGNDFIHGRNGDDTYHFTIGDGRDQLKDGADEFVWLVEDAKDWYGERGGEYGVEGRTVMTVPGAGGLSDASARFGDGDGGGYDRVVFGPGVLVRDVCFARIGYSGLYVGYGPMTPAGAVAPDSATESMGAADHYDFSQWRNSGVGDNTLVYGDDLVLPTQFETDRTIEEFVLADGAGISSDAISQGLAAARDYIDANVGYLESIQSSGRDARGYVDQIMLSGWRRVNEQLNGTDNADLLMAGDGDDTVLAGAGDDSIEAGFGADLTDGGAGNDTYRYDRWDGSDTVSDGSGLDTLQLGIGIRLEDLVASLDPLTGDLVLGVIDEVEQLRIEASGGTYSPPSASLDQKVILKNFHGLEGRIETFRVEEDGITLSAMELYNHFFATEQDDTLGGLAGDNAIVARAGNDIVATGSGSDTIAGGPGNDSMAAGLGDDLYWFGLGDGADTIHDTGGADVLLLREGALVENTRIERAGDNVTVTLEDGSTVLVRDWALPANRIENIVFGDGTVRPLEEFLIIDPVTRDYGLAMEEDTELAGGIEVGGGIDGLLYHVSETSEHGGFTVDEGGNWRYTPDPNFNGQDRVTVRVTNVQGRSAESVISFTVNPVNDVPVVTAETPILLLGTRSASGVLAAGDVDGDPLSFLMGIAPECGDLTVNDQGHWAYIPHDGHCGNDGAVVTVDDGNGGVATVGLQFEVNVYDAGEWTINGQGPEVICLGGVSKDDLQLTRDGDNLYIAVRGRGSITMAGYFAAPDNGVDWMNTLECHFPLIRKGYPAWTPRGVGSVLVLGKTA